MIYLSAGMTDIRVCWIFGNFFESRNSLVQLRGMLGEHLYTVCSPETYGEEIEAEVTSNTLFDSNKLIVLRFVPRFIKAKTKNEQQKRMIDVISRIPHGNLLVFDGIDSKDYPQLFKHVAKIGKVLQYPLYLKHAEAQEWMKEQFGIRKINMTEDAVSLLMTGLPQEHGKGISVDKLHVVFKKLQDFMGNRKKIEKEDILAISETGQSYAIWDLFNAMDDRDYDRSVKLVSMICDAAKDEIDAIQEIFSFCSWRFKILLFIKDIFNKTNNIEQITASALKLHKFERSGTQSWTQYAPKQDKDGNTISLVSPSMINSLLKGYFGHSPVVSKYNIRDLLRISTCCEEASLLLRLEPTFATAMLMIDNLLMTVCEVLPDTILSSIRNIKSERSYTSWSFS